MGALDLEAIREVYTFWESEKRVVSSLKERLLAEGQSVDVPAVSELASDRKAGHCLLDGAAVPRALGRSVWHLVRWPLRSLLTVLGTLVAFAVVLVPTLFAAGTGWELIASRLRGPARDADPRRAEWPTWMPRSLR